MKLPNFKFLLPVIIAGAFHFFGALGISMGQNWFVKQTPLNMLISLGLVFYTAHLSKNTIIFFLLSFFIGMLAEWVGVNTQLLFGNYYYGNVLGYKIWGVPILIGINWFLVTYCCSIVIQKYFNNIQVIFAAVLIGLLTTMLDFVIEPIAIKLNFWQWSNGVIPFYNYFCWFIFSSIIGFCFIKLKIRAINNFPAILLLFQFLFFLILNCTL